MVRDGLAPITSPFKTDTTYGIVDSYWPIYIYIYIYINHTSSETLYACLYQINE